MGTLSKIPLSRKDIVYSSCLMAVVACLIISNVTGSKLYTLRLFNLEILVPVGTSLFCLTFLATGVISEIWGRTHAIFFAIIGLITRTLAVLFFIIAIEIPPADIYLHQDAYAQILGSSSRMMLAGIIAFFTASVIDAYIFEYLKKRHSGKNLLFLRNNVSTFVAQLIGVVVFVSIAFYNTIPNDKIIIIAAGNFAIKWLIAIIDTPFVYMVRNYTLGRKLWDIKG